MSQKQKNMNNNLIKISEAAKICGVNIVTMRVWADKGKVECIKDFAGHRYFNTEELRSIGNGIHPQGQPSLERSPDSQIALKELVLGDIRHGQYALFTSTISLATADRLSDRIEPDRLCIPIESLSPKQREWFKRPRHCDRFMRVGGRSWSCPCGFTQPRFTARTPMSAEEKYDRTRLRLEVKKARTRLRSEAKKARFKANKEAVNRLRELRSKPES